MFRLPIEPDTMPLRETLRGVRHVLRRGGHTVRETVGPQALPGPAAVVARLMLRDAIQLAGGAGRVASGLAKFLIVPSGFPAITLDGLRAAEHADVHFAATTYAALRAVLARLGAPRAFVSEAAARQVYARHAEGARPDGAAREAAVLTLAMLDARVVRGLTAEEARALAGAPLECVAVFAVMLWLQSDRPADEEDAVLQAATDLAAAIAPEIGSACAARDASRIERLYTTYASHV